VVADPVGDGFVASLSRPGGNITGFSSFDPEIGGKWVQLLKEVAPAVTRGALLFNPRTAPRGRMAVRAPLRGGGRPSRPGGGPARAGAQRRGDSPRAEGADTGVGQRPRGHAG